jgi:hypothetical protein
MGIKLNHVHFDFDGALELARQMWRLADRTDEQKTTRVNAATTALTDWKGRYSDDFRQSMQAEVTSSGNIVANLRADARTLAGHWVRAMDQEAKVLRNERIEKLRDDRGFLDKAHDFFLGDDRDYEHDVPPLPPTPAQPQPPQFLPTAQLPRYN